MATRLFQNRRPKIGNYFVIFVKVFKFLGVSFADNESLAYRIYSYVILFAIVLMYPILDTYELTKHGFEVIAGMVSYQTAGVMAMTKVAIVLRNRVKIRDVLDKLEKAPFAPNPKRGGGDVEEKLIRQCLWTTNTHTLGYWIVVSITGFGMMFYTLLKRIRSSDYHDWQFPYGPLTVLNVTYSPNFEISWLYQCTSGCVLSLFFTVVDLLLAAVLAHISCQFKMLQNSIRRLVETSHHPMVEDSTSAEQTSPDESVISWNKFRKSLEEAVSYHVQIVDLANEVDEVFTALLLMSVLGTLSMLCFSIFTASVVDSTAVIMWNLGEGCCCAIPVFMICYWGEKVNENSQLVGTAAYESNFVGTDLRYQKSLVLIIRRSQNPTIITAGKFAVISLSTFAWILQRAYSSFMVLRGVNADTA